MSNFIEPVIDLGNVRPGKVVEVIFTTNSEEVTISAVLTTCHCIQPIYKKNDTSVKVKYTIPSIPMHLAQLGVRTLPQEKKITATLSNGVVEELKFKYVII